jgi:diguanylate cyclase (GGDEF)-like protein
VINLSEHNQSIRKTDRALIVIEAILMTAIIVVFLIFALSVPDNQSVHAAFHNFMRYPAAKALFVLMIIFIACFVAVTIYHIFSTARYERMLEASHEKLEEQANALQELTEHDDLTGLFNRHYALDYLRDLPRGSRFTLLMMNVDRFKDINDVYGTKFGDYVLTSISRELKRYLADCHGFAARYGSDEFLILFMDAHYTEDSIEIRQMREIIHEPIRIGMASIIPTVCIGCAYSDGYTAPLDILARAEVAARTAKKNGKKVFLTFTGEMLQQHKMEVDIRRNIRSAIEEDGFYMVYQPKVDIATMQVCGFEALVRMQNSSLSPAQFIPIAEEIGLLREIGRITTQKTIRQIAQWMCEGYRVLPVSINFSSVQIRDTGYFNYLTALLREHQVPTDLIQIEVTERIMVEFTQEAIELMNRFHNAGFKLLLDDFGTGFSSLSYLNHLPLDVIKIDKSFLDASMLDHKKQTLMRDIIRLGHDLGNTITVEGVETRVQFEHLKAMEADTIQGYYFSRPLPPEKAIVFSVPKQNEFR